MPSKIQNRISKFNNFQSNLKTISFFSGALGLDLGFQKAGFDIFLCVEKEENCRKTILANNDDVGLFDDVLKCDVNTIEKYSNLRKNQIDVFIGGAPCQSFSTAGKRLGVSDSRGNLLLKYIDLIKTIKPRVAVLENVQGLLSIEGGNLIKKIIKTLKRSGYGVMCELYNTADFGVAQVRKRVILIAILDLKHIPPLKITHSNNLNSDFPRWKSLKDVIFDLDESKAEFIPFPKNRLKYFEMLKEGENWRSLPIELQKEALGKAFYSSGGRVGFYRKLSWDKPACTLLTSPIMKATAICHPSLNRPLSVQEYKRIQQFSDDYCICGSTCEKYKQIGNAVPVEFSKIIANHIKNVLTF